MTSSSLVVLVRRWLAERSVGVAVGLSVLGFVCAVLFAVGPAVAESSGYEWSPGTAEPSATPLMLVEDPARIEVTIPAVDGGDEDMWLEFATAAAGSGLGVVVSPTLVVVRSAGSVVQEVPWPPDAGGAASLMVEPGAWSLRDSEGNVLGSGSGGVPQVAVLRSEGPLAADPGFVVVVDTQPHGLSPSARQWGFGLLALMLAVAGPVLLLGSASRREPDSGTSDAGRGRWLRRQLHPVDGAVMVIIGLWVVLGPAFYDDGWALTRQRAYPEIGRFSGFFTNDGASVALGYWADWLQHWWTTRIDSVLLLRIPIAMLGLGTWALIRATFGVLKPRPARRRLALVTLAAGFLIGYTAWLQTLRPEPLIAVVAVAVLWSMTRFNNTQRPVHLWIAGLLAVAAVTVHPAGIVATAPIIASARSIWAWVAGQPRSRLVAIGVIGASTAAIGLLLLFIDSDLSHRLGDVSTVTKTDSHPFTWRDELQRYELLSEFLWATPVRRMFVMAALGTVASWVTDRSRTWSPTRLLPVRALTVGLLLLFVTPSKWPWHFGALTGLMAVALALEVTSWTKERTIRGPLITLGVVLGAAWAWSLSEGWGHLDLLTLRWKVGASNVMPASLANPLVWVTAIGGLAAVIWLMQRRRSSPTTIASATTSATQWTIPIALLSVIVFTIGTFASDTRHTPGWTLATQITRDLRGQTNCGLGDYINVPTPGSFNPLPTRTGLDATAADSAATEAGFPTPGGFTPNGLFDQTPAPLTDVDTYGWLPPDITNTTGSNITASFRSDWYQLEPNSPVGLITLGQLHRSGTIAAQYGNTTGNTITPLSIEPIRIHGVVGWNHQALDPAPDADMIRILGTDATADAGGWLAITQPITYRTQTLTETITTQNLTTLTTPELALYFPCAQQPSIAGGVAQAPHIAILLVPLQTTWLETFAPAPTIHTYITLQQELSDRLLIQVRGTTLSGTPATTDTAVLTAARK